MRPSTGDTVRCTAVLSDDFKVTSQLPIGDRLAELAFLPLARGGEVIDESVAEIFASHAGLFQTLCCVPQCSRQREAFRELVIVSIAGDQRLRLDAILDAPQSGAERSGACRA